MGQQPQNRRFSSRWLCVRCFAADWVLIACRFGSKLGQIFQILTNMLLLEHSWFSLGFPQIASRSLPISQSFSSTLTLSSNHRHAHNKNDLHLLFRCIIKSWSPNTQSRLLIHKFLCTSWTSLLSKQPPSKTFYASHQELCTDTSDKRNGCFRSNNRVLRSPHHLIPQHNLQLSQEHCISNQQKSTESLEHDGRTGTEWR